MSQTRRQFLKETIALTLGTAALARTGSVEAKTPGASPIRLIWGGYAFFHFDEGPRRKGAVAVQGNRILEAGNYPDLAKKYRGAETVGWPEAVLLPAFVDGHDHGRGIDPAYFGVPDGPLEAWVPQLSALPALPPELVAAYDALKLMRSGVGTVVHSHNAASWKTLDQEAHATLAGYSRAGMRVAFHQPMLDQNTIVYKDQPGFLASLSPDCQKFARDGIPPLSHDEYFALCRRLLQKYPLSTDAKVQIQISPCGGQWASDALLKRCADFARETKARVHIHLLETRYQQEYAQRTYRQSFLRHFAKLGFLGPWLTCAHMIWVDKDEMPLLKQNGVGVIHNASSNLRLRSGAFPLVDYLRAGVTVGFGLDGMSLDGDQDLTREMRLAIAARNPIGIAPENVEASQIWKMATEGGARAALGGEFPLGRLQSGQLADLQLIDARRFESWAGLPAELRDKMFSASYLLAAHRPPALDSLMIGGEWVMRGRRWVKPGLAGVESEMAAAVKKYFREHSGGIPPCSREIREKAMQWYPR